MSSQLRVKSSYRSQVCARGQGQVPFPFSAQVNTATLRLDLMQANGRLGCPGGAHRRCFLRTVQYWVRTLPATPGTASTAWTPVSPSPLPGWLQSDRLDGGDRAPGLVDGLERGRAVA